MSIKSLLVIALIVILIGILDSSVKIWRVEASGTIYIRVSGLIDPPAANITSADNVTYNFVGNIKDTIVVERSNIVIDGNGYTLQGNGSGNGLHLYGVSNVTIKKARIKGFGVGIYLNSISCITISENNITNNGKGIRLDFSSSNNIIRNNIEANVDGIWLHISSSNNITWNKAANNDLAGIYSLNASYNLMFGNTIEENYNGVVLKASSNSNVLTSNKIQKNKMDGVSIREVSANNSLYENNIINNGWFGIRLGEFSSSTISKNNVTDNNHQGIYLETSSNNNMTGNNIINNEDGIWLYESLNNNIVQNNIANSYHGITFVESSNSKIYHNNFVDNTYQVYDYSWDFPEILPSINTWDDGHTSEGNYWSGYTDVDSDFNGIGDSPQVLDELNEDHFPLFGIFSSFNAILGDYVSIVSNSSIEDFQYIESNRTIKMHVSNKTANQISGFCRISIPHTLIFEPYTVTIDGANPTYWNYSLFDSGTHRWIYFSYEHSTVEIAIVPETNTFTIWFLALLSLSALIFRKSIKHFHKPTKEA